MVSYVQQFYVFFKNPNFGRYSGEVRMQFEAKDLRSPQAAYSVDSCGGGSRELRGSAVHCPMQRDPG